MWYPWNCVFFLGAEPRSRRKLVGRDDLGLITALDGRQAISVSLLRFGVD